MPPKRKKHHLHQNSNENDNFAAAAAPATPTTPNSSSISNSKKNDASSLASMIASIKPPRPAPRPGPTLSCHGVTIDRPFDWLKNRNDPEVLRYLREEELYCFRMQKLLMANLQASLNGEIEALDPESDAMIPAESNGYFWWNEEGSDEEDEPVAGAPTPPATPKSANKKKPQQQQSQPTSPAAVNVPAAAAATAASSPTFPTSSTTTATTQQPPHGSNVLGHKATDKYRYYRLPDRRDSTTAAGGGGLDFVTKCATLFRNNYNAEFRNPKGTQTYLDLNIIARRYNLKYCEEEEHDLNLPSCTRVAVAVDTTLGAEEFSIFVIDCATQRQLALVGPASCLVPPSYHQNNKTKKARVHGNVVVPTDVIACCAGHCLLLDDETLAFVEMEMPLRRACRVWSLHFGEDDEQQSNSEQEGEEAAAATTTTPHITSSVASRLKLLFEEPDPEMEICGLFRTSDNQYACIATTHTICHDPIVIPLAGVQNHNFEAVRFMPTRVSNARVYVDHDPRPIEFFLSGGKKQQDEQQQRNGGQLGGGTWFITHDMGDNNNIINNNNNNNSELERGLSFQVYICSDDDGGKKRIKSNEELQQQWHPFFIPKRKGVAPLDAIIIEQLEVSRSCVIITARRRCVQTLFILDLVEPSFSCPIDAQRDLIDVHSLIKDDPLPARHSATWIDINEHSYDATRFQITAHNVVLPDREYLLLRGDPWVDQEDDNDAGEVEEDAAEGEAAVETGAEQKQQQQQQKQQQQEQSSSSSLWQCKFLLAEKAKGYDPDRYTVAVKFVPARRDPEVWHPTPLPSRELNDDEGENNNATVKHLQRNKQQQQQQQEQQQAANDDEGQDESAMIHIPVLLVYKTDKFRSDGSNPLLLESYSSYGDSHDEEFDPCRVPLLNRGIIFAVAALRGGGELGEEWRRGGARENRKNTFHDCVAVADFLKNGPSRICDRIVIRGESAGGGVVAAAMQMRPDLFAGVVARVPFVDVLGTMLDSSIPMTALEKQDWGDPTTSATIFHLMHSYSPVENVPGVVTTGGGDDATNSSSSSAASEAVVFPHIWVESGINDTRVQYSEPAIWVAKLRQRWAASAAAGRVLLHKIFHDGGHGGSVELDDDQQTANEFAFICFALGIQK